MIQRNSTLAVLRESFVAGSDENLSPIMHHLWKMEGGAIYFCRSVTGDSAKKIIDDFAILEIKVLLQSTELTMQDIADRLGFPDQSYLGRYFKRHEGMSPREYQNRYVI